MKYISVLTGKISMFILEKFGRGSSMPGAIARKLDRNIINKFELPKTIIAVTGSSGKTSTAYMIYHVLKENGYKVASNIKGSNLLDGTISLLLKNSTLSLKSKVDVLVLEVDERYTKQIFDHVEPTHIVLSNITRDQPPRHGDYKKVYNVIKSAIPKNACLIINGDDPISTTLSLDHEGQKIYYGMTKNKDSYEGLVSNCLDMVYCPKCNHRLEFDYVEYSNVGKYKCSNCEFERPKLDYEITAFKKDGVLINDKTLIKTNYQMLYFNYNVLAAYALLSEIKVAEKKIIEPLNNIELLNQRFEVIDYKGRKIEIMNGKCENAISFNQAINHIRNKQGKKTIIFGFEYISKRYSYKDVSWLYDIDFEFISNVDKFICVGPFASDIASRIYITDINKEDIIMVKNVEDTAKVLDQTEGNIYAILNMGTEKPFIKGLGDINEN